MGIEKQEDPIILRAQIEMLTSGLSDLYLMIDTIILGLETEQLEPQVIACFKGISHCIGFLRQYAKNALEVNIEDEEGHEGQ